MQHLWTEEMEMKTYTVSYTVTYEMTVEVEAPSKELALDEAYDQAIDGNGTEHDISYGNFEVIQEDN